MVLCGATAAAAATNGSARAVHGPRPSVELHLDAGIASGGDPVAGSDSLGAGDGYLAGGGVRFTPFWGGEDIGLGVGLDVLFKYGSMEAGAVQASHWSVPALLTGHALVRLNGDARWYLMFRGGVETDLYMHFSFNGTSSGTSSGGTGVLAEVGPIFEATDNIGVSATVRFTLMQLPSGMDHFSASNVGVMFSVAYNLASRKPQAPAP
jgi:hypothetical protein